LKENLLLSYQPLEKQALFHEAGRKYIERCLLAGNQYGKTYCGAAETALHLTGMYDDLEFEWMGRRWERPVNILVIGHDFDQMRESCQKHLFGRVGEWGTGMIPKDSFIEPPKLNRDRNGIIDYARIRHISGGASLLKLASEKQGPEAIMGGQWDAVWWDEMPKNTKMYSQGLARLTKTAGIAYITATPEDGYTDLVARFLDEEDQKTRWNITASAYENKYLDQDYIKDLFSSYTQQELLMRVEGIAVFGAGPIYPFTKDVLCCKPFSIPEEWPKLSAIDPGYQNSKTAILWGALDIHEHHRLENCTLYVFDLYNRKQSSVDQNAIVILNKDRMHGYSIPMAWPKDANQAERSDGKRIAMEYRKLGVRLMNKPASLKTIDGKQSFNVIDGINEVYSMIERGKLKIFDTPVMQPLIQEMQRYSMDEEGKIINKQSFDNCDALRYMVCSRCHAGYGDAIKRKIEVVANRRILGVN